MYRVVLGSRGGHKQKGREYNACALLLAASAVSMALILPACCGTWPLFDAQRGLYHSVVQRALELVERHPTSQLEHAIPDLTR